MSIKTHDNLLSLPFVVLLDDCIIKVLSNDDDCDFVVCVYSTDVSCSGRRFVVAVVVVCWKIRWCSRSLEGRGCGADDVSVLLLTCVLFLCNVVV